MTYLDIVNGVLRRLRETTVATVDQSTYSLMVGDYINDAKRLVEAAWDWSANRKTFNIDTVDGTDLYALDASGQDVKILGVYNSTQKSEIAYVQQAWVDEQINQSTTTGSPVRYTFRGVDADDDTRIQLWPTPDRVDSLRIIAVVRQADLSDGNDVLAIPSAPVLHLAVAMLAEERGEFGGVQTNRYFQMADKFLSDAVAFDSQKNPDELVWYTPGTPSVRGH